MCKKCGKVHDPNKPCPDTSSTKTAEDKHEVSVTQIVKMGLCPECGTAHTNFKKCPRADR